MPKTLERKLKKTAQKRGYKKDIENAYVYGTLRKLGWSPRHSGDGGNYEVDHSPQKVIHHSD